MDREDEVARLSELCESGELWRTLERYLTECLGGTDKRERRFPNAAGLARQLGVSVAVLKAFGEREPGMYGRICAVLEDEALNADVSAALISAYLKQRLGYGDREEETKVGMREDGALRLIFEHDILADGE